MDQNLREELMVTYGYLLAMNGKPVGTGMFGNIEKIFVPESIVSPLKKLLFPVEIKTNESGVKIQSSN